MSDPTPPPPPAQACPKCGHMNPVGVRFCANCGQPSGAAGAGASDPGFRNPSTPPPPQIGISLGAGDVRTVNVPFAAGDAYTIMSNALTAQKGRVVSGQSPSGGTFSIVYNSIWTTLATPVKFIGEFSVRPNGNSGSTVSYSLKLDYNSLVAFVGIVLALVVLLVVSQGMGAGIFILAVGAINVGYSLWSLSGPTTAKIMDNIAQHLQNAAAAQPAYAPPPPAPPVTPPPAPAPGPSPGFSASGPSAPASALQHDEIIKRLKSLSELRDIGAITQEDFDAKKTELLAQL